MASPVRILMLEDAPEDAVLVQRELRKAGIEFTAHVVDDEEPFLRELADFRPDLVLSDNSLPRMDGAAALRITREASSELPFIFVTGSMGEERAIEMLRGGATDYVLKDRLSRLVPAVRRALQEADVKTLRLRAEEALRESEERYALAVQGANDGLFDWDLRTGHVYYSLRWGVIVGDPQERPDSQIEEWLGRIHPDDAPRVRAQLDLHLTLATPHFESEHRVRREDGSHLWVCVRGLAVRSPGGEAYRMAGSMSDISDRKRAEAQLAHNAVFDVLTGLPNRTLLVDRLAGVLRASSRPKGLPFGFLLLDVDRFKVVNDSLGHTVGDRLLVAVAQRLVRCVRPEDTVARLGGDEYAILLDEVDGPTEASRVAETVHRKLTTSIDLEGHALITSVSIGLVVGHANYANPQDVLRDGNTALYRAKSLGRARTEIFDEVMGERAREMLLTEAELGRALERREFVVHYQPILSLSEGTIVGCEALVRWNHPTRGLVPPADFIPVAESSGAIVPIGAWVLREACDQAAAWKRLVNGSTPVVSVNLSPRQFRQKDLYHMIARTLRESALPPALLKLEVTESAVMDDVEEAAKILRDLKELGIRFSMDDFGTGYSCLSHLKRLPFNTLKIDRSFVTEVTTDPDAAAIATAVVSLAHTLKMEVVAEGIETEPQRAFLRSLECDEGQGYLFGRPMSADALERLIRASRTVPSTT